MIVDKRIFHFFLFSDKKRVSFNDEGSEEVLERPGTVRPNPVGLEAIL